VVYALACNSIWINHCYKCKVIAVVQVKKNNVNSIKQIKIEINKEEEEKENWCDEDRKLEIIFDDNSIKYNAIIYK